MKTLLLLTIVLFPATVLHADAPTVAQRRARSVLVDLHRGAWEFGPPNTMAAFRAARVHGADMLEIDIRRTADNRLVCFHDDMVDGDLDGVGAVAELTLEQLRQMPFAPRYPRSWRHEPVPLFAEVLAFARKHALLFHLDVKVPGIDGEIARMLTEADYWQGVATVNDYNSELITSDPRCQPLPVKGGLLENNLDCEFDRVGELLRQPGRWLIVDEPRVCAAWLNRTPGTTQVTPSFLSAAPISPPAIDRPAVHWLRELEIAPPSGDAARQRQAILRRARAALNLGIMGADSENALAALRARLRGPAYLADAGYHLLDAAMAARSLGRLSDATTVADLRQALAIDHSASIARELVAQNWKREHVWWVNYRLYRECLFALAQLGTAEARAFLEELIGGRAAVLEAARPHLQAIAAEALVLHGYPLDRVVPWLAHRDAGVRRRAFLTVIARPEAATTTALCRQIQLWIRSGENQDAIALIVSTCPFLLNPQPILDAVLGLDHPRIRAARAFAVGRRHE